MNFPGWELVGRYESGVGSWLLTGGGEALLLEVPEGLRPPDVRGALAVSGCRLKYVTASHDHWDHLDEGVWGRLQRAFPRAAYLHPRYQASDVFLDLGGEPLYLIRAPKHSRTDLVTVYRGVAMTGDIELGTADSACGEVPAATRRKSMKHLAGFFDRRGYRVHTTVSAHLDDLRTGVDWKALFEVRHERVS